MAKRPTRSPRQAKSAPAATELATVPTENIEILKAGLGVDVTSEPNEVRAAIVHASMSVSTGPYPSAEMFDDYIRHGMPEMVDKVIKRIDQQFEHRQRLEIEASRQNNRRLNIGQYGGFGIAIVGTVGSLIAGYMGVSAVICMTGIIVTVGGPSTAAIAARLLDRAAAKK